MYYFAVNHGENPLFLGQQCVPKISMGKKKFSFSFGTIRLYIDDKQKQIDALTKKTLNVTHVCANPHQACKFS